jgi:hypothetical protein
VSFKNSLDDVIIQVPRLDLWGVLRLECSGIPPLERQEQSDIGGRQI